MSATMRMQFCHLHKSMESYPACEIGYPEGIRYSKNTQLPEGARPVVWEHPTEIDPETGRKKLRYPGHTGEMPDYYKSQGYERKEFLSYQEHKKFCEDNGMINHAVEGIRDEALEG